MNQTNTSIKGRSYQQKQQTGEEEKALTPVEAAPKTIPIDEALHEGSKHMNASSRRSTSKNKKHTDASLQLQPQPPKSSEIVTAEPRSTERYTKVPIAVRKYLPNYL